MVNFNWIQSQCLILSRGLGKYAKPPKIRRLGYMEIILRIFIRRTRKCWRISKNLWIEPYTKNKYLIYKELKRGVKIFSITGVLSVCGYAICRLATPPPDWRFQEFEREIEGLPPACILVLRLFKELEYYSYLFLNKPKCRLLPIKTGNDVFSLSVDFNNVYKNVNIAPESLSVVLELRDLLVTVDHSLVAGWRYKKRPGLDELLDFLCNEWKCEIIIYSNEHPEVAFELIEKIDKDGKMLFRVISEWPTWIECEDFLKNLELLNRPLNRLIAIDTKQGTPLSNFIIIPPWQGEVDDLSLYDLKHFLCETLKNVENEKVKDIRQFISRYSTSGNTLKEYKDTIINTREEE